MPRFGCHVSISGGLELAVERARRTGCDAFQIFTRNARQWAAKPLDKATARVFRTRLEENPLPAFSHAGYLLNLASANPALRALSIETLGDEIDRAEALGLLGVVIHPGACPQTEAQSGLERVASAIDRVLRDRRQRRAMVLVEHTAGQGGALGHRFEHHARILELLGGHPRVGLCLDTCHLLASGYDVPTAAGYRATFDALSRAVGLDRVRLFHVNDSKARLGSRVDRHAHIGKGRIGVAGFRRLVNDRRFADLPMLLETEKTPGRSGTSVDADPLDLRNLRVLRGLVHVERTDSP